MKIIKLNRIDYGSHLGGLMTLEDYSCYTLNHSFGGDKEPMPDGEWEIKLREEESPMWEKWEPKYHWFIWFLELQNVPNREHLYIHSGNYLSHSKGCELVGEKVYSGAIVGDSVVAMAAIYDRAYRILEKESLIIVIKTLR